MSFRILLMTMSVILPQLVLASPCLVPSPTADLVSEEATFSCNGVSYKVQTWSVKSRSCLGDDHIERKKTFCHPSNAVSFSACDSDVAESTMACFDRWKSLQDNSTESAECRSTQGPMVKCEIRGREHTFRFVQCKDEESILNSTYAFCPAGKLMGGFSECLSFEKEANLPRDGAESIGNCKEGVYHREQGTFLRILGAAPALN